MTQVPEDDEQELAEAEALARALDGAEPSRDVEDAVDAAEVVRMLKAPVLSDERLEATLADTEQRIAAARRRSRTRIAVFGAAGSMVALAAAALLLMVRPMMEPGQQAVAMAPAPEPAALQAPQEAPAVAATAPDNAARLRNAQIVWLGEQSPSTAVNAMLDEALREYRDDQLAALERKYAR